MFGKGKVGVLVAGWIRTLARSKADDEGITGAACFEGLNCNNGVVTLRKGDGRQYWC